MKEKILVLYGGKSVEHDISVITAMQVLKNLPKQYDYLPVYIDRNGLWWTADNLDNINIYSDFDKLSKNKCQISLLLGQNILLKKKKNKFVESEKILTVLNCCHGNIGEDGSVQGLFKVCGVAQTSPSVTSSALCMDKAFMKDIFKSNSIESPEYVCFDICTYQKMKEKKLKEIVSKIKFPLIVKPANLGSSIGISFCKDEKELEDALSLAFEFDKKVVVEKMIENLKEFNCACFFYKQNCFLSKVAEVTNKKEIYSFEDKYLSKASKSNEADARLSKKIKALTEKVYRLFDCQGVVRVDFLYDCKSEKVYVNEINTIPGSMAFYLFKDVPFKDLMGSVIEQSLSSLQEDEDLTKSFKSDALKLFADVSTSIKK